MDKKKSAPPTSNKMYVVLNSIGNEDGGKIEKTIHNSIDEIPANEKNQIPNLPPGTR